jgi:hypothetical protein
MRIGQRDDLAAIGRIGQDFLIAGHGGVEHHLAAGDAIGADGLALENRSVGEGENGGAYFSRKWLNQANSENNPRTDKALQLGMNKVHFRLKPGQ